MSLPNVAVMTMTRDEGHMLRRWVEHYGAQVGVENLVVLDDNTSDGSTDNLPCPVIPVPNLTKNTTFIPAWMSMISHLSAGLLDCYDAVIYVDVDEFIVPEPRKYENLRQFVADRPGRSAVGVMGLNMVHDVTREGPLVDDEPIIGQRRLAKFLPLMCKPSVKWVPAGWALGTHGIRTQFAIDPELFMFHMKFVDRGHLLAVAEHRNAMHQGDGRASHTSWEKSGDEMTDVLDEITRDIDYDAIKPFRPPHKRLERIVAPAGEDIWRAQGLGQVAAMRDRQFVRIPRRFVGLV